MNGILGDHIVNFLKLSKIQDDECRYKDSLKFVSNLKKSLKESKNNYKDMFSNIQSIISYRDTDSKRNLDEKIMEDIQSFKERRYDSFEKTIIEVNTIYLYYIDSYYLSYIYIFINLLKVMKTESDIGNLHMPSEKLSPIIDDANEMVEARDTSPYPQIDVNIRSILKSPVAIEYFKAFTKKELFSENLQFWLEVEKYKKNNDPELREKHAKKIYDRYISDNGDRQINIDVTQRQYLDKNIDNPSIDLFESCQKSSFELLTDNFPRFLESEFYVRMMHRLRSVRKAEEYMKYSGKKMPVNFVSEVEQPKSIQTKNIGKFSLELHSILNTISSITCILEVDKKIWAGCEDGTILIFKYSHESNSFIEESRINEVTNNSPLKMMISVKDQLLCLDKKGQVHILNKQKLKVRGRLVKGDEKVHTIFQVNNDCIWVSTDNSVKEYIFNEKKKKWSLNISKEVKYQVQCFVKVQNYIWAGDSRGYITKYNKILSSSDRFKVNDAGISLLFRSDNFSNKNGFQTQTYSVWTICRDGSLFVIDGNDSKSIKKIENCHDLPIIAVDRIGKYIIFTSEDCTISLWDSEKFNIIERLPNIHKDAIICVYISSDERFIFCGSQDKSMSIFEKVSNQK